MTTILVVDDEAPILRALSITLSARDYTVVTAANGTDGLAAMARDRPAVVILDLGLPDMDGKEVLARLRAFSKTPVIVLAARDRAAEKIAALDLGADDYVEKPFAIGELLARLRVALRHAHGETAPRKRVEAEGLVIDTEKRLVTRDGEPVKLTPREYDLLCGLALNSSKVMTHRQLLTAVWGPARSEDVQYLRVFVGQLRAKVDRNAAEPRLIVMETGVGYRFHAIGG